MSCPVVGDHHNQVWFVNGFVMGGRFPPESIARATDCDGHWETMLPWETSGVLIGCTVHTCNAGCLQCHNLRNKNVLYTGTVFLLNHHGSLGKSSAAIFVRSQSGTGYCLVSVHMCDITTQAQEERKKKKKEKKYLSLVLACVLFLH